MATKNFSSKTLKALSAKGVQVTGVQLIPGAGEMPWANAEKAFTVNDNGTGRVLTFTQVLDLAK